MKKYTYVHSFQPILPAKVIPQSTLVDWVIETHAQSEFLQGRECNKRLLRKFAVNEKQISQRFMECPDSGSNWEQNQIYCLTEKTPTGADIFKRNHFFSERAEAIFKEAYHQKELPDHLIHVSCTGYIAPSAPQRFFSNIQNPPAITHAYHMGCYASLPALRMAKAFALENNHNITIFHNEMCSLHMHSHNHEPEQIVVQTLFGDGHIHYQVSSEQKGFRILTVKERIIPDSLKDMSWIPASHGMSMTLSRDVPIKIRDHIFSFVSDMAQGENINPINLFKNAIFAIHPGGPRIIDLVQQKLELGDHQVRECKKVLFERGNMSSSTLPHVWNEILFNKYASGTHIVSLAFGPGLTIFGSIFEVQ